jgi:hypothetical protein
MDLVIIRWIKKRFKLHLRGNPNYFASPSNFYIAIIQQNKFKPVFEGTRASQGME